MKTILKERRSKLHPSVSE